MSKIAEEKAVSEYPSLVPKGYDEFFRPEYEQNLRRCGFIRGYDLARKENIGLTWEDIPVLEELINEVHSANPCGISAQGFGEEVLRRFNESKE